MQGPNPSRDRTGALALCPGQVRVVRFGDHVLECDAGLLRECAAVLVLRGVTAFAPYLDAHGSVRRLDFLETARLHATLRGMNAQSERRGLGKDELRQRFAVLRFTDHAEQRPGTALLH